MADHVVCFRSVWEGSAQGRRRPAASIGPEAAADGAADLRRRLRAVVAPLRVRGRPVWVAMFAQAHMERYGVTTEQLAQIALNGRRNAALNPKAIYRDPMTMDDYLDVPHDLDAPAPLRLRRAVRRRHGDHRVARRTGRRSGASRPST